MKLYNILFVLAFVFALSACGGEKKGKEAADDDKKEQTDDKHSDANHDEDKAKENTSDAGLDGEWNVVSVGGDVLPEEENMILTFDAEGNLIMTTSAGDQKATFALSQDGKSIDVKSPDGDEVWQVKELTENKLVLLDKETEIVLKR